MAAKADGFRRGMQRLASGVSVVAAKTAEGRAGLTATAVCSLTADPPSLLACVNRRTWLGSAIATAEYFSVNVLRERHLRLAQVFAGFAPEVAGAARFGHGRWEHDGGRAPILADALVSFTCRVDDLVARSTHWLVIGEVVGLRLGAGEVDPLLYVERGFATVALDRLLRI